MTSQLSRSLPASRVQARSASGVPRFLYNNVWRKSNVMYLTYILAGCVVLEAVYGGVTNYLWESANKGVSCLFCLLVFVCWCCVGVVLCGGCCGWMASTHAVLMNCCGCSI
jgi:hypothetical protein